MSIPSTRGRRNVLKFGGAAMASLAFPVFAQSDYPSRPIRIILPLSPGGVGDAMVRNVAERMTVTMKRPVIVDNKPGGQFLIGYQAAMAAPADGYTLLHLNVGMAAVQASAKRYDMLSQLVPITEANTGPTVLFVSADAPFATVPEMLAYGRSNPGKINYGSSGPGSLEHLLGHSMCKAGGFDATNISYKGGPDIVMAIMSGDIQVLTTMYQVGKQHVEKGNLRVLGVFADQRVSTLPNLPTMKEFGLDVPSTSYWGGYAVRSGVPASIVETLHSEIAAALMHPSVREKTEAGGSIPAASATPAEFSRKLAYELEWMRKAASSANLNVT